MDDTPRTRARLLVAPALVAVAIGSFARPALAGDPGEARAEAVRRFLNEQGVALNRMATISYGPDAPVAPNDTPEGRAQNRRVVIIVLT